MAVAHDDEGESQEQIFRRLLMNGLPASTSMLETVLEFFGEEDWDSKKEQLHTFAFETGLDFLFCWSATRSGNDPDRCREIYFKTLASRPHLPHLYSPSDTLPRFRPGTRVHPRYR